MYEFVEHHIDEHGEEDERVRPRPVRDELLHDRAHAPALLDHVEEFCHCEREEDRLEREGDDPAGEKGERKLGSECLDGGAGAYQ